MRPNFQSLTLGVYLPLPRTAHVVLLWALPPHGSYLSQGFPAVAWVLHEPGYPLLVLELMALKPPFSFSLSSLRAVKEARALLVMS